MQLATDEVMAALNEAIAEQARGRQHPLPAGAHNQYPPSGSIMSAVNAIHSYPRWDHCVDGIMLADPGAQSAAIAEVLINRVLPLRHKNGRTAQHADAQ